MDLQLHLHQNLYTDKPYLYLPKLLPKQRYESSSKKRTDYREKDRKQEK